MHIHTALFSPCAKGEAVFADMVKAAEQAGLKRIAFTEHVQAYELDHLQAVLDTYLAARDALETELTVLIGAELSAFDTDKYTLQHTDITTEFNMYAANHYHCGYWGQPGERTAEGYKQHNKQTMQTIIRSGKCDCIAHPFVDSYIREDALRNDDHPITAAWTDTELGDILELAREHGVAWELSPKLVLGDPVFAARLYRLGKEIGSVFTMGTDAHNLVGVNSLRFKEDYKRILV